MQVLCKALQDLHTEAWGGLEDDEMVRDPYAVMVDLLRALPLYGMPVEILMGAYAWTSNDTESISIERARLADLIVGMLRASPTPL